MSPILLALCGGALGWSFVSILESAGITRHNWQLWAAIAILSAAQVLVVVALLMEKQA